MNHKDLQKMLYPILIFMNLVKNSSYIFRVFNEVYGILISTFHIITNFLTGLGFLVILALRKLSEFLPLLIIF